jgi:hypothetical protein
MLAEAEHQLAVVVLESIRRIIFGRNLRMKLNFVKFFLASK